MGFTSLGLSAPILRAIQEIGYDTPSPVQAQAIPAVLKGHDVMAAAQTGTGKTAGFTLPILERLTHGARVRSNHVRALILTPTRELAAQIQDNIETYSRHLSLSSTVVFGGVKINPQMQRLTKGADILVATPGRLLDLHQQNAVKFAQLEVLVLDEADRMLDMGFLRDVRKILKVLPAKRQNLLFSATFSQEIRDLAKGLVNNPVEISVNPANSTARTVEQCIYPADVKKKPPMLAKLIKEGNWQQVLVFTRTKHGANRLAAFLTNEKLAAAAIHGNKSQGARTKALADFKSGQLRVLVATDIAARGIDIPQLPQVVNFELPKVPQDYVHRIGRTGRAGETGKAISLVSAIEAPDLFAIERLTQQLLPRLALNGYQPTNPLPESKLDTRPIKPKKPKKPKKVKTTEGRKPDTAGQASSASSQKPKRRQPRRSDGTTATARSGQPSSNQHQGMHQGKTSGEGRSKQRKPSGKKPLNQQTHPSDAAGKTKPAGQRRRTRRPSGAAKTQ
ncbi:ATP-dependent RNA helicase RhlE [Vibrio aerogenes CECT 7868]|uniref:ATP-dependent RNA helicase RhlE n=1 Tax=Vibrio aerogenes CECT 7868 TaxID=1216006 RepID=A0A1M5V0M3_9VIBR|nr:DEAD/DEAH box helicase [Vibrio aerogenes]SHH68493.1 ATP-dependent RNA helicase RhlE [Vibrio aerogenes CECT 7868]